MARRRCYGCMSLIEEAVCPHCGFGIHQNNDTNQLPVGTLLKNQYLIGKVLGHGGFGITYIGFDVYLEMVVAIKEFYPSSAVNRDNTQSLSVRVNLADAAGHYEQSRERFLREAKTLAKLSDVPQIVGIQGYFTDHNTAYIIMEYVRGVDLRTYVQQRGGAIPAAEVFRLMEPVLLALDKVHAEGLVHRDISPDNIMLQPGGGAKLLDFGAVRDVGDSDADIDLSHSTEAILKHGFAPMEQYRSRGNLGPWTDEYGLCASMYYCMSGRVPPDAPSRAMDEAHPDWSSIPGLTELQRRALDKGMSMRAKDRFCSMDGLHRALYKGEFAAADPGADDRDDDNQTDSVDVRRNRAGLFAAVAVIVILVGAVAAWYLGGAYLPEQIRMESVIPGAAELLERAGLSPMQKEPQMAVPPTEVPTQTQPPETLPPSEPTDAAETEPPAAAQTEPAAPDAGDESITVQTSGPWIGNVLKSRPLQELGVSLGSVTTVTFLDTLEAAPVNAIDVSGSGNGMVLAWGEWADGYHVKIAGEGGVNGKNACANLFNGCANLQAVDFGNAFHTEQATTMVGMFSGCPLLTRVDLTQLNTSCVENMSRMFAGCRFSSLDLRHFDTSSVRDMSGMFQNCTLKELQIGTWDTSRVEDMSGMFRNCTNLLTVDVKNWDVSGVTVMTEMFAECNSLNKLEVSGWDVSRVSDFTKTFYYCNSLPQLDVSRWDVSSAQVLERMFSYCSILEYLDVSRWDVSNVYNVTAMFAHCNYLAPLELNDWEISQIRFYEDFVTNDTMINGAYWRYFFEGI